MMTEAVADLAPDPALPQRDLMLDIPFVTAQLSRLLGNDQPAEIDSCERLRVNYQFGRSLRVLHRIGIGGSSLILAARTFRDGRGAKAYQRGTALAVSCEPSRPLLHDAELDTVFWTFPNDRRLSHLPAVSTVSSELRSLVPGWSISQLKAYAPEKSATFACLDDDGRILAYAKVGASSKVELDVQRHEALGRALSSSDPHLRLPRVIGYSEQHRTLVLEPMPGRRLADVGAAPASDLARVGAALATLHGLDAPAATPVFARFDADRLLKADRLIGSVRPDVAGQAGELARLLTSAQHAALGDPVCLHGDVHPKNAILAGGRVALIDVEELAVGPAAADLGSLLAGVIYWHRVGRLSTSAHDAWVESILSGYTAVRPLPSHASLGWHTAAALFIERGVRAVTRMRPLGLRHLDGLLGDARQIVTEVCDV
jgi:Ser/Thr protein kinase RdoA (MazF antagonist)